MDDTEAEHKVRSTLIDLFEDEQTRPYFLIIIAELIASVNNYHEEQAKFDLWDTFDWKTPNA
jgi:hypothetical protein